jgi:uncharacterized protein YndB with AHSA1/START domain
VTDELGEVRRDDDGLVVQLARRYDATREEVWAAFTEPPSIARWLFADAVLEPGVGGRAEFRWSENQASVGHVLAWEPPALLELTWNEQDRQSVVRVEISADGRGTLLVLEHRQVPADSAIGLGAGWHAHLVALRDVLDGRDAIEDRWQPLFDSLRPRYAELVDACS